MLPIPFTSLPGDGKEDNPVKPEPEPEPNPVDVRVEIFAATDSCVKNPISTMAATSRTPLR